MASGHRWNKVGNVFVDVVVTEYENRGIVHWPTAIGATACLCGETALVAHESRLPEYGTIDSRKVADFVHDGDARGRTIWGYSTEIARQAFGVEVENLPTYRDVVEQLGTLLLPGSFPALTVAAHVMPHDTPMNAGPRLRKAIHAIAEAEGLNPNDSSFALATAAMKMIGSAQHLGVRDLTLLALQCGVAGSRFAPALGTVANPAYGLSNGEEPPDAILRPVTKEAEPQLPASAAVAQALGSKSGGFGKRR